MNAIETQMEYVQQLTDYLAEDGVSALDILDALASLGLQLQAIEGENISSVAYMSAIKATQE